MDTRESLTVRTATAFQRLADLEEKGRTLAGPRATVVKIALRELEAALEELRVATEQLSETVSEMAQARLDVQRVESQFNEFRNLLPVASITTDRHGQILDANAAAGDLLNVAARHLPGKPLSLYMVDRDRFFSMLNGIRFTSEAVRSDLGVRPRERKSRPMVVQMGPHRGTDNVCWFFLEPAGPAAAA